MSVYILQTQQRVSADISKCSCWVIVVTEGIPQGTSLPRVVVVKTMKYFSKRNAFEFFTITVNGYTLVPYIVLVNII